MIIKPRFERTAYYGKNLKKNKGFLTDISPTTFGKLAPPENSRPLNETIINQKIKDIKKRGTYNAGYLIVDKYNRGRYTSRVKAHEGRHTAEALRRLGIKKYKIAIIPFKEKNSKTILNKKNTPIRKLRSQYISKKYKRKSKPLSNKLLRELYL